MRPVLVQLGLAVLLTSGAALAEPPRRGWNPERQAFKARIAAFKQAGPVEQRRLIAQAPTLRESLLFAARHTKTARPAQRVLLARFAEHYDEARQRERWVRAGGKRMPLDVDRQLVTHRGLLWIHSVERYLDADVAGDAWKNPRVETELRVRRMADIVHDFPGLQPAMIGQALDYLR